VTTPLVTPPLVTIVVPTYNSRATLRCALESIQRQDFADFDVHVAGDGCTDGSGEVVEALADPRFHWTNRATNFGSASLAYRDSVERARGRYIAYLGHDDLWLPWHLSALLDRLAADPAPFAHTLCVLVRPSGAMVVAGPPQPGISYRGHFVPPSAWLHERTLALQVGNWRDPHELSLGIDADLLQRFAAAATIVCSPRVSVLKWPSQWWRAYASDAVRPQVAVAAELARDPQALSDRVLQDIALSLAREAWEGRARTSGGEWRQAAAHATAGTRLLVREALDWWGSDRWPVAPVLRWRYQRILRSRRALRGLPRA
jgi:glycosyltransferase involved in cell wall biosynthesis